MGIELDWDKTKHTILKEQIFVVDLSTNYQDFKYNVPFITVSNIPNFDIKFVHSFSKITLRHTRALSYRLQKMYKFIYAFKRGAQKSQMDLKFQSTRKQKLLYRKYKL